MFVMIELFTSSGSLSSTVFTGDKLFGLIYENILSVVDIKIFWSASRRCVQNMDQIKRSCGRSWWSYKRIMIELWNYWQDWETTSR